ncbi:MAG: hypothetical protein L6R39_004675 [Caloplaca ligustica]|nr:MAG: hypothetical protein L6R39_004675 [Caloplaca ligustica]
MALEDFERSLEEEKRARDVKEGTEVASRKRRKHHHHDHHHHRHRHHHEDSDGRHRDRRSKHSDGRDNERIVAGDGLGSTGDHADQGEDERVEKGPPASDSSSAANFDPKAGRQEGLKRDAWMEEPSAIDIDYIHKGVKDPPISSNTKSPKADFELKIHDNELNKHYLQILADGKDIPKGIDNEPAQHAVDYVFGDSGAQWRMTKLKAVYRRVAESGLSVDDIAVEQYGDLRAFDDAREEEIELERRETYGEGYVGKEKPSGELFEDRKLDLGTRRDKGLEDRPRTEGLDLPRETKTEPAPRTTVQIDQTALNRLKARMMKAQLKGSPDAARLESEYKNALRQFPSDSMPQTVVLGAMDNRMLAGGQRGEAKPVDNKRGRERGLVEENEDMSIEDMVREERRTRGQPGGDGQRFAERIAKDSKFDNDLDYMDENATKLAKRVQRSEINLKNTAVSDFQKINRILDNCPLCHHEDSNTPPIAPIVSLATRVYLTLPTEPEISDGGSCIIPIQHRGNLLECDDDEWEEIRNFMKSLTRMYHDQGRAVIFYENAAAPQRKKHAGMECVPLPYSLGDTAPAFFKEAILTSDEEWTQHKKLIDTLAKAKQGAGKLAFRRTLAKEMPYFHVWFEMDGGLGHIVEDANRWPKGDLFAREIIGGMLDKGPDVIKRQGRWQRGEDGRVEAFRKRWRKFDWTRILTDSQP